MLRLENPWKPSIDFIILDEALKSTSAAKGDVSRHGEVVKFEHVRNTSKSDLRKNTSKSDEKTYFQI